MDNLSQKNASRKSMSACILSLLNCIRLFVTLWTVACQAPLSSKQEYWSGLLCPPPGYLPNQGLNPHIMSPALAGKFFTSSAISEALLNGCCSQKRHTLQGEYLSNCRPHSSSCLKGTDVCTEHRTVKPAGLRNVRATVLVLQDESSLEDSWAWLTHPASETGKTWNRLSCCVSQYGVKKICWNF